MMIATRTYTAAPDLPHESWGPDLEARFEWRGIVGLGGFAQIHRVIDRANGQWRALKLLRADMSHSRAAHRSFATEVRAYDRLRWPGLATLYDTGISKRGLPWMALELLEGATLSQLLRRHRRLTFLQATALIATAARAVSAIHAQGVFHRDLNPSNIMLLRHRRGPARVVILDFGLAVLDRASLGNNAHPTSICGTPSYMAPEQIRGIEVGPSCDIYALGAMLCALLTGHPPFAASHDLGLMLQHALAPFPRHLSRQLPPALLPIIKRAMAKTPQERHPSAFALRQSLMLALQNAVAGRRQRTVGDMRRVKAA